MTDKDLPDENIVWVSHGTTYNNKKKWFLFPFKSLSYYIPNDTMLSCSTRNIDTLVSTFICPDITSRWVKMPVLDILNKNYKKIIYSDKKKNILWNIIDEEKDTNIELQEILDDIEVDNKKELYEIFEEDNSLSYIIRIIECLAPEHKKYIEDLFCINKQTQLIHLRKMNLEYKDDSFKNVYGIWKCLPYSKPLYIAGGEYKPKLIKLANAFQMLEDILIEKGMKPSECNIKMVCCRNYIHNKTMDNILDLECGVVSPKIYTKKSLALNTHLIPVSENILTSYLKSEIVTNSLIFPDLEEGETSVSCPSNKIQPKKCNNSNIYRKQALIFHPDRNRTCKKAATAKFYRLNELCKKSRKSNKKSS